MLAVPRQADRSLSGRLVATSCFDTPDIRALEVRTVLRPSSVWSSTLVALRYSAGSRHRPPSTEELLLLGFTIATVIPILLSSS